MAIAAVPAPQILYRYGKAADGHFREEKLPWITRIAHTKAPRSWSHHELVVCVAELLHEPRVFLFLAIRRCLLESDRRLELVLCWFLSHAPPRQKWKERRKRSRSTFLHTSGSSSVPKILFFRSLGFLKLRCAVIPDLTQPPIGFEHLASCSCHVVVDRGMIFFDFGMDRLV